MKKVLIDNKFWVIQWGTMFLTINKTNKGKLAWIGDPYKAEQFSSFEEVSAFCKTNNLKGVI